MGVDGFIDEVFILLLSVLFFAQGMMLKNCTDIWPLDIFKFY